MYLANQRALLSHITSLADERVDRSTMIAHLIAVNFGI